MDAIALEPVVHIVDDSREVRDSLELLLGSHGLNCRTFPSGGRFLAECPAGARGCALLDVRMPTLGGFELQRRMGDHGLTLPVIVMTAHGDVPMAVRAMKGGAVDFIQKPFRSAALLAAVREALKRDDWERQRRLRQQTLAARLALLTEREREVLHQVSVGRYNKVIAGSLGLSVSTVEADRNRIMRKLRGKSLYDLVQMAELDKENRRPR